MPGAYKAVAETRTVAPGGVAISCKEERKYILEAKVLGGKVDLKKKPAGIINIELEVKDYVAENKKTCQVAPPGFSQTAIDHNDGQKTKWWRTAVYSWPLKNGHSQVIGSFKYTLYHKNTYCDEQRRRDLAEAQVLFKQKVADCIKKSGVVTRCNTDRLSRCVQADYKENTKMKSFDSCIESALIDGWEEGLANCIKNEMEWYNLRLTVIDEKYKWCMEH